MSDIKSGADKARQRIENIDFMIDGLVCRFDLALSGDPSNANLEKLSRRLVDLITLRNYFQNRYDVEYKNCP